MTQIQTIILPVTTESPNENNYGHYMAKHRKNKELSGEYRLLIQSELNRTKIKKAKKGECYHLEITSVRKRLFDHDNSDASNKLLIDCLRRQGFIWDDDPKHLRHGIKYRQYKLKETRLEFPQTIISRRLAE